MNLLTLLFTAALVTFTQARSTYPIVLVHGIVGWGRDEMFGIKYFGGLQGDIEKDLKDDGNVVFTAAVGPLSSNWDRACELFAQIKGGRVDYGEQHARHHGHARFGRTYPGFYKEWGTKDEFNNTRKIHLVGHSMGGQTSRMLAQLLSKGTENAPTVENPEHSILFQGGHEDWIHSVTAISTPHDGTLFADVFGKTGTDLLKNTIAGAVAFLGIGQKLVASIYDFKLDQWGLQPLDKDELFSNYIERVLSSHLFQSESHDMAIHDCTTLGAKAMNQWVKNQPNIYYYSYSTSDTQNSYTLHNWKLHRVHIPNILTMLLPLQAPSTVIGGIFSLENNFGYSWQENDGIVNTISMRGTGETVDYGGISKPGRWHYMPHLDRMDHLAVCGWTILKKISAFYKNHAKLLHQLPIDSQSRRSSMELESFRGASVDDEQVDDSLLYEQIVSSINELKDPTKQVHTYEQLLEQCEQIHTEMGQRYCALLQNK